MGFELAADTVDIPWIKTVLAKLKWRDGLTDEDKAAVGVA